MNEITDVLPPLPQHTTRDVYSLVTNRIIEQLEKGTVPWKQPWTDAGTPQNLLSKRPYTGINVLLLTTLSYQQNCFLTFEQVKEVGAKVNKGEHGHMVVFWKLMGKRLDQTEDREEHKPLYLLRYYYVFNIAQCTGIPEYLIPIRERPNEPIKMCEEIVKGMPCPPAIQHKEQEAYYHREKDVLNMPKRKSFMDSESYYVTLFHELVHSTGHQCRLNRREVVNSTGFGSTPYSIEELTAEIGACFLMSHTGIKNTWFENSVAYLDAWLGVLKKDKRFIIQASSQAQRAVDYILNKIREPVE